MADWIADKATKEAAKDIEKNFKDNSTYLKLAASLFLQGVKDLMSNYYHINNILQNGESTRSSLNSIYQKMKNSTEFTQKCIGLQYTFESALNKFLGR